MYPSACQERSPSGAGHDLPHAPTSSARPDCPGAPLRARRPIRQYLANKGHHDHLICTGCGTIVEFENCEIERLQEEFATKMVCDPNPPPGTVRSLPALPPLTACRLIRYHLETAYHFQLRAPVSGQSLRGGMLAWLHPSLPLRAGLYPRQSTVLPTSHHAPVGSSGQTRCLFWSSRAPNQAGSGRIPVQSGIQIELLSSGTTELVNRFAGRRRPQPGTSFHNDAGSSSSMPGIETTPAQIVREVERAIPPWFRASDNGWIGLSGRFWIVVYNTNLVKPEQIAPYSIWLNRSGKTRSPFQTPAASTPAGVSVIKATFGDDRTKQFLQGLKANAKHRCIRRALANRGSGGQRPRCPRDREPLLHLSAPGRPAGRPSPPLCPTSGRAGWGHHGCDRNRDHPHLEACGQCKLLVRVPSGSSWTKLFADLDKEYPLHPDVKADPALVDRHSFRAALVPLARLAELREKHSRSSSKSTSLIPLAALCSLPHASTHHRRCNGSASLPPRSWFFPPAILFTWP